MRDRSKQLLVINTGKKQSEQTGMTSQSGTTHIIGGGGLPVNISDYLLKSIWDKVFEIRTDSQGTEYIFGKLPMVTQYGITMYSGDGVDIPSLASGLPFDGRTIWYNPNTNQIEVIGGTGGGSGEGVSNFWDLSGIPSWITNSKPKYTYSEIEDTPDFSGYATQSWVKSQGYVSAEVLSKYIPISGYTEVSGEKNFTGGLKVNGSPIYYDTEKKYWKLEGDLLVTGGVTMYGNEGTYTPSTIMDALLYDDTTLGINSNGELYVKGGTSGGGLDITALQNYLTQNSYLNVTGGDNRYLMLSGGTLTGTLTISVGNLIVSGSDTVTNSLYPTKDNQYTLGNSSRYWSDIYTKLINGGTPWTSANDGSGSGLDADLLDGKHLSDIIRYEGLNNNGNNAASAQTITYWGEGNWGHGSTYGTSLNIQGAGSWNHRIDFRTDGILDYYQGINTGDMTHIGAIAFTSSNVSSATKLQTARTIWGQSFDGTGDIEGAFRLIFPNIPGDAHVVHSALKYKENPYGLLTRIYNDGAVSLQVQRESNVNEVFTLLLNPHGGNVGIGTPNPQDKLDVAGNIITSGGLLFTRLGTGTYNKFTISSNTTYGIEIEAPRATDSATGTALPIFIGWRGGALGIKITSGGNLLANGGITMYSDQRKKTILNHVELSLKQIAEAPLIEHYYNSDEKRTTHVGSIAQYWASMNDWFCKLDSEGFYTMEIQNAALASAISIARELNRYETNTDKAIKKLKERIRELEEEVERLKSA